MREKQWSMVYWLVLLFLGLSILALYTFTQYFK